MDFTTNPRATFDYEILETFEAGLALRGFEVKAVKNGAASIRGAYVKILGDEAWLIGARISPYQTNNTPQGYQEQADRKLLISRQQLRTLVGLAKTHGVTLIPMKLYGTRGLVKLQVGVARGKKKYDKRESIRKKDIARARQRGTNEE